MQMTNEEILRSFKNASDPRSQIGVLADLNACGEEKIRDILKAQEVDARTLPRKRETAAQKNQKTESRPGSLSIVQMMAREWERLLARRSEITKIIEQLREEQTGIGVKLKALESALPLLEGAYAEPGKSLGKED